jgi:hypothetical protein
MNDHHEVIKKLNVITWTQGNVTFHKFKLLPMWLNNVWNCIYGAFQIGVLLFTDMNTKL